MARTKENVSVQRRIAHPPAKVFGLVSDAKRQVEWLVGPEWSSCKVEYASGPLCGPNSVHIRVLENGAGKETVDRLETQEFEPGERVAFSDGRFFELAPDGDGTLVTGGHEIIRSKGPVTRKLRKAIRAEGDLIDRSILETDLGRIEQALDADGRPGRQDAS